MNGVCFSFDMVPKVLSGSVTKTVRPVVPQPDEWVGGCPRWHIGGYRASGWIGGGDPELGLRLRCPWGAVGTKFYVRETAWYRSVPSSGLEVCYLDGTCRRKNGLPVAIGDTSPHVMKSFGWVKKPSIQMPAWASRRVLRITAIDMLATDALTDADASACLGDASASVDALAFYWDRRYLVRFAGRPLVWLVSFVDA